MARCYRSLLLAGVILLIGLAAPSAPQAASGLRVAVLEFDNASAGRDLDALGKGLQSMLTTDLSQVPTVQLVERARLADVQAELKLSKSGQIDARTAARIGKLAGASHLLGGSYTVVGERMRLDCRLFAVDSGAVLLAEKQEGERDAFFELEKQLVGKLVEALGVRLRPKERAEVARVHTADFEAFRRFSQGVALFDEKRYDEAVAALRDATGRDRDFKLARLTLDSYEKLILELRGQAGDARAAEEELKRLKLRQQASNEAQVLERLWEAANRKGGDKFERLAALYLLALAYGDIGNHGEQPRLLRELRQSGDRFAMLRTGDALSQRYYAEAAPLFPQVPPVVSAAVTFASGVPSDPARVPAALADLRKNLLSLGVVERRPGASLRWTYFLHVLSNVEEGVVGGHGVAARMHLDLRQIAQLRERFYEMGRRLPGGATDPKELQQFSYQSQEKLGEIYRQVLDLDRSTAFFAQMGKEGGSADALARATREVEFNRDLARLLEGGGPLLREYLMLERTVDSSSLVLREAPRLFPGGQPGPLGLWTVNRLRRLPRGAQYLLYASTPGWALVGGDRLLTGARVEPLRAEEIRYHRSLPRSATEPGTSLVVLGGHPTKAAELRLEVSFKPAEDFWPPDVRPGRTVTAPPAVAQDGRPEVGVLYGLRDLDAGEDVDPKSGERRLRPLVGNGLLLTAAGVQHGELRETTARRTRGPFGAGRTFTHTAQEQRALRLGDTVPVQLRVRGDEVEAVVAGQRQTFKAAGDGYLGLLFRGPGYAAVRVLQVRLP